MSKFLKFFLKSAIILMAALSAYTGLAIMIVASGQEYWSSPILWPIYWAVSLFR